MGLLAGLGAQVTEAVHQDAGSGTAPSDNELALVESEITAVLTVLSEEADKLRESRFPSAAHIRQSSFGVGVEASQLGGHHTKAHAVVTDVVRDLIADLEEFHAAVKEARDLVGKTDEEVEEQLTILIDRTNAIDEHQSESVDDAQSRHSEPPPPTDDAPTPGELLGDDPAGEPGTPDEDGA